MFHDLDYCSTHNFDIDSFLMKSASCYCIKHLIIYCSLVIRALICLKSAWFQCFCDSASPVYTTLLLLAVVLKILWHRCTIWCLQTFIICRVLDQMSLWLLCSVFLDRGDIIRHLKGSDARILLKLIRISFFFRRLFILFSLLVLFFPTSHNFLFVNLSHRILAFFRSWLTLRGCGRIVILLRCKLVFRIRIHFRISVH